MKRISIIREDNVVCIDGVAKRVDCSKLPGNVHAIQWGDSPKPAGHVEYISDPIAGREPNKRIDSIEPYQWLVDAWNARDSIEDEKKAEREDRLRRDEEAREEQLREREAEKKARKAAKQGG